MSLTVTSFRIRKKESMLTRIISALTIYSVTSYGFTQETEYSDNTIEEVVVTGIRGSLQRAQDIKRDAVGVVDSIASEDLGKFPDQNVAESLQRITGVSIDRSGGEGQFITVRGFGPQFNAVLINGRQVATDNQGREFSFDTLAAELISGTDVFKSPTASMQEGGIGATINVKTARPFDNPGLKAAGSIKGVYDDLTEETSPQLSGLVSNTFADDTFGVLLSLSHQERKVQNNIIETRYYRPGITFTTTNPGNPQTFTNAFVPQNFDIMVDEQDRTRTSGSLVLQFSPNDNLLITADTMVSKFKVDSETYAVGHWFSESNFIDAQVDANNSVVNINNANTGATDFIRRSYSRDVSTQAFGLNVEWNILQNFTARFDASTSQAEDNTGGKTPFTVVGYNNAYVWDNTSGNIPTIDINGGQAALLNTNAGRIHYNERNGFDRDDEITEFKADFEWIPDSQVFTSLKFGAYYQDRTKDNQRKFASTCSIYCGYAVNVPDTLLSRYKAQNYFSGVPNSWLTYDPEAYFAYIGTSESLAQAQAAADAATAEDPIKNPQRDIAAEFAAIGLNNPSTAADQFSVDEEVYSAYIDLTFEGTIREMPWQLNAGVRYSETQVSLAGFTQKIIDLQTIANDPSNLNEVYDDNNSKVVANNKYNNVLPSVNLRLDIQEDMLLRLGYSKTLTRPTMESLAPSTIITVSRPNNIQATGGNSELKPFVSNNLDLSYEWYYSEGSYIAAAVFYKEVDDFITNTVANEVFNLASGDFNFAVRRPNNGETAEVEGVELAWTHLWDNGIGVQLNATMVNSDAEIDLNNISNTFALEGLGDSQNAILFYEKGPLQARVAFNNREGFLQNIVNPRGGTEPLYTETYGQWDLSASYDINDNLTVFIEGVNLTGEETRRHGRFKNQLISLEDNGSRYAIGIRATF